MNERLLFQKAKHFLPNFPFFQVIGILVSFYFKVTVKDKGEADMTCLTSSCIFKIIQRTLIINKKM